jgi:WD40 repeat protein/uncharacterized caspase-like protein
MKRTAKSSRIALPVGCIFCLVSGLFAPGATSGLAQTSAKATATPQAKPGTSIESTRSANSSQEEQKPELVLQTGYNSSLGAARLVFSPDGRLLATTTFRSGTIKLWETATGRELRNLTSGGWSAPGVAPLVAFSPNSHLIASTSGDSSIQIWDVTSGRKLQTLAGSQGTINSVIRVSFIAFSANGQTLVAIGEAIRIWDVATWRELRSLDTTHVSMSGLAGDEGAVAISPDGRELAIVVRDDSRTLVKSLDLTNGRELRSLNLPNKPMNDAVVSFTPDGRLLVSAIIDKQVQLWEVSPNEPKRELGRTRQDNGVLRFSRDGRLLALSEGETVKLWDVTKGHELAVLKVPNSGVSASSVIFVGFSDDGKRVATAGFGISTVLWETKTGKQLLKMSGRTNLAYKVAFSADGTQLSSGGRTRWDMRTGRGLRIVSEQAEKMFGVPSSDGGLFPTFAANGGVVTIVKPPTRRQVQTLASTSNVGVVRSASFSRDGTMLLTTYGPYDQREGRTRAPVHAAKSASNENQAKIWDVNSGRELHSFMLGNIPIDAAFSPDSRVLATLDGMGQIWLWDTASGKRLRDLSVKGRAVTSFAFSTDGLTLAMGHSEPNSGAGGQISLWDLANGKELGTLPGQGKSVTVAFSRDSRLLASSNSDDTITIWDVTAGRKLRTLVGHTANINSIDFSPEAHLLASASDDGSTFLWDTSTGEHLLTLISLDDGNEWMVVTPQGLFDGTPISWNQILWRYNQDTFNVAPIEWFFNEFYSPGLLADVFAGKRPRVVQDVSKKDRRQPVVKLSLAGEAAPETDIARRTVKVRIDVTDAPADKDNPRGTGARDLRLFRNGSLVKVWHGDVLNGHAAVKLEEEITVTAGANRLTAYAFNKDNVKSKDAQLSLVGADSLRSSGTAYIIAVGLNEYENAQYNLKYAVADAQSFSEELRRKLSQASRFEHVEIVPLINENATKANITLALNRLAGADNTPQSIAETPALNKLRRAAPEDTVIIYFAGHGTAQGQRFYLIPHDLGYRGERTKLDEQGLRTILSHSISDVELERAVEDVDAGHFLLFIDACNSGQALEAEEKRRGPMNSKGLAQLAYEKGMYILTAAQSYQAALEAAQLGHGLLTYALVEEGLKTEIADTKPKDGVLNAREWLDFATERVPQMQEQKMKEGRGIGLEIAFTEGEQDIRDPRKRSLQRPRVFYRRELEANPLVISRSETAKSETAGSTDVTASNAISRGQLSRWIDLQTATLGVRYRWIESSAGITVANQAQDLVQFKGRFKFDQNGNYSVNAGIFTGNNFVAGFNDTGLGTGRAITNLYLKQLYFSAKPVRGVEVQFGGLYFNRGESTEITTYDNDGYLMGERLVVQRPKNLFFDEISVTYAFLGDFFTPNINKRWHGLGQSNYHQFLLSKKIGERAVLSADYTFESGRDTFRQAVRVNTPEFKVVDFFRLELYQRAAVNPEGGLAAYAEKGFLKKRLTVGGGYAQIDPNYGGLNADRFNRGRRFFFNGSYKLSPEFTISTFYTHAFKNDFPLASRTRFEVLFSYNLRSALQKTGLF